MRGRLRIYLGAAPGVGKTYAMLGEAHRRAGRGTDVVVGFVESHGRPQTEALLDGLEIVPRRTLSYRGADFAEMDLDAVLDRRPAVACVDELAHTNVPGSRNEKRWQDIEELLAAGIDVISTVNIQHLESLNDVVEAVTGIRQQETVPDPVVRKADQIELVDMSPEALRRRLAHGNVYAADKVDAALGNYFRVGNLTALREAALLWVADRVEEGLERYRAEHGIAETWAARQRIVVALTGGTEGDTLLRRGAVIAGRSAGRALVGVHVIRSDGTAGARPDDLARLRRLTEDLGGTFHTVVGDDVAAALLEFARSVNGTQVVVGATRRSRWSAALRPSTADEVVRESGDIDVHVVTHHAAAAARTRPRHRGNDANSPSRVAVALVLPVGVTALMLPLRDTISLSTVLLVFLMAVVGASLVAGLSVAVASAVLSGLLANWFYTPPFGELTISEPQNAFALTVFVLVAVVVATIVDRSRRRAAEAAQRRAEATALASLSLGLLRRESGVAGLLELAMETFGMRGAVLLEAGPDGEEVVIEQAGEPPATVADAGVSVDAGPGLTLALNGPPLPAADRRILDAFAAQTAALLDRQRLAVQAAEAERLVQVDAIRTALLAAVSHDLRTPLAGIKAALATLRDPNLGLSDDDRQELLAAATDAADRLGALLANLLDLSRLQTGAVRPIIQPTDIDEIVLPALRGVPEERVTLAFEPDPPLVLTDAGLLERALANLIENAVRHSPEAHPVVVQVTATGDHVDLRVVDRGPGVPERDRATMFAPFQRLGDAPDGIGVGLGLAVARGLTDAVGGQLHAEDTPGGGLTMVLTLPRAHVDPGAPT